MSANPNNNGHYIGRLVRNPVLRKTESGKAVTNFTLAVDRNFADKDGNWQVDFIDFVAWNAMAERIYNTWKQGDLVAIDGPLQIRTYEKDGKKHSVAEVRVDGRRKLASPAGFAPLPAIPEGFDYPPAPTDEDFRPMEDDGELPL